MTTRLPSTRELAQRYIRLLDAARDVLDVPSAERAKEHWSTEADARPAKERGRGRLTLPPSLALTFRPTALRGFRVYPDLYFVLDWSEDRPDGDPFTELDLKLRVWVPDEASMRPSLDHEDLLAADWRVGLRVHFDRHAPGQLTPRYHFQAGGKPEDGELCQLYEEICEPRVPIWPLDFALALQLVLKGFFPDTYRRLGAGFWDDVATSEQLLVRPCLDWIRRYFSLARSERLAAETPTLLDYLGAPAVAAISTAKKSKR